MDIYLYSGYAPVLKGIYSSLELVFDSLSIFRAQSLHDCPRCQKQFSQYTCPRCNSRYCSLQCYKSHSLRCTESFMRENVMGQLQELQPDNETKQKMLDILARFHSQEEMEESMDEDGMCLLLFISGILSDDSDPTLSEETVQKILSGGKINFDDLSADEKKRFQRAVAYGELSKLIEPWDPWWLKPAARTISLSQVGTQLVQPLVEQEPAMSLLDTKGSDIPPGPETPLPRISKLSSSDPSPLLAVHLVDIVYSYCFTLRLYNGDWQSDAIGSAMVVLSTSSVLGQGGQPETVNEALLNCLEQICSPAFKHMGGLRFGLGLMDDVISLLSLGGAALVCLLCDLQRLIQAAERELKSEQKSKRAEMKSKLKSAERKVYFVMCWVHEQPGDAWSSLADIVKAEKAAAMEYGGDKGGQFEHKVESKGKVLIEEFQ
ncbi:hypothetical protein RJ640_019119 [Escallonia rubra]|uniref:HIT-type domain-containing protein n=1 Tax=Escallonia rubra TaxID=112253 RepID=A0AA88UKI8_9ASTE|nr:hypothetical protein RJ640_019119 [Escallonia rubra]